MDIIIVVVVVVVVVVVGGELECDSSFFGIERRDIISTVLSRAGGRSIESKRDWWAMSPSRRCCCKMMCAVLISVVSAGTTIMSGAWEAAGCHGPAQSPSVAFRVGNRSNSSLA
jgi:hypothetical protein